MTVIAIWAVAAIGFSFIFGTAGTNAAAHTGTTIRVQLVRPDGTRITDLDSRAVVSLSGTPDGFFRYAGRAYWHRGSKQWAGDIVNGVATFPHLPKGTWVVSVDVSHAYQYSIRNELEPPRNRTLDVALPLARGATISGRVTRPSGSPASGIVVGAVDETGRIVHRSTTDRRGDYHLVGLDSGAWRVEFNSKPFGEIIPAADYAWNYWRGAGTFSSGGVLRVHSESRSRRESDLTGIDGTLSAGALVSIERFTPGPLSDYSTDTIDILGGHSSDYVQAKLVGGRSATARLAPGSYLLRVIRPGETSEDSTAYWYAGSGRPAVREKARAVPLVVPASGTLTVDFGAPPP